MVWNQHFGTSCRSHSQGSRVKARRIPAISQRISLWTGSRILECLTCSMLCYGLNCSCSFLHNKLYTASLCLEYVCDYLRCSVILRRSVNWHLWRNLKLILWTKKLCLPISVAEQSWGEGLRPFACWNCVVRIPLGAWLSVSCECCVFVSRSLCDGPIPRPEEPYRLCCVIVCDLQTSRMRQPWPELGCFAIKKICLTTSTKTASLMPIPPPPHTHTNTKFRRNTFIQTCPSVYFMTIPFRSLHYDSLLLSVFELYLINLTNAAV